MYETNCKKSKLLEQKVKYMVSRFLILITIIAKTGHFIECCLKNEIDTAVPHHDLIDFL